MIIVCVYHILSEAPSIYMYLDPVESGKNHVLDFEPKAGFHVVPGQGASVMGM